MCVCLLYTVNSNTQMMSVILYLEHTLHKFFAAGICLTIICRQAILAVVLFHVVLFHNLTKVRPLFTLSHRGSDNSPLVIVFSANNIDQ